VADYSEKLGGKKVITDIKRFVVALCWRNKRWQFSERPLFIYIQAAPSPGLRGIAFVLIYQRF